MKFDASRHISSPSIAVYYIYMSLHFKCDVYLNYKTLFIQRKLPSINFRVSDPYLKMDCPTCNSHVLRAMAPHSSTLAWRIPCVEEPGGL